MFSSIFYQNKIKFPNEDKMKKLMKESMKKFIGTLDEKYKKPLENHKLNFEMNNNRSDAIRIKFFPLIIFGVGFYQLCKGLFSKL
uniref:Uncharacterized protein n=1 Tax=viral metagenome TaxID=1070528 RepID=A0A6C0HDD5_9ZZZZ